jgi:glycosyltransferase involved in cell wall biosynthesis
MTENKTRKKIIVRGPALSRSGYGEQCRFALRCLKSKEDLFDIYLLNTNWGKTSWLYEDSEERRWIDSLLVKTNVYLKEGYPSFDLSLQVTIPNEWEQMAPINVGYTAGIETSKVAPVWLEKSKQMDKIIVISNHAKDIFENTQYTLQGNDGTKTAVLSSKTPIDVVHYAVQSFEAADVNVDLDYDFNFLAVAQWSVRKNVPNMIRGFIEEFIDQEVGFVLKMNTLNDSSWDREATKIKIQTVLRDYPDRRCKIYLLHGQMSPDELNALYNNPKIKALVSLAHGEGFGLPMFEAAYNGLPVIAPAWSGHCDFLYMPSKGKNKKTSKKKAHFAKVDYDLQPIQPEAVWDGVLQADSLWCYPKQGSYKMKLREVYKDHGRFSKQAQKLQEYLKNNFTEEEQYRKFTDSICSIIEEESPQTIDWMNEQQEVCVFD